MRLPKSEIGKTLDQLEFKKHGVEILFVHREYLAQKVSKLIKPDENPKLEQDDNLVLLGLPRRIAKFIESLGKKVQ